MAKRQPKRGIYFTDLFVENVKAFKGPHHLDLRDSNGGAAAWTLLLGDNGVGKTTLLQCLAMMAPFYNPREAKDGSRVLQHFIEPAGAEDAALSVSYARRGDGRVEMKARFTTNAALGDKRSEVSPTIETMIKFGRLNGETSDFEVSEAPSATGEVPLVIGYGAGRHMALGNFDPETISKPAQSLFDGAVALFDVEELLQHLEYAALKSPRSGTRRYRVLLQMIADLLPDVHSADSIKIVGPEESGLGRFSVRVTTPYGDVSIRELSYGYQTVAAWLCDIAWRMFQHYPKSPAPLLEPAIVLVDEIDLHLHPIWQRRLREGLLEHFPAVQFIATAHSPLMAQASIGSNLAVLTRHEDSVYISNEPPSVHTWRLDQVITSELFGLPTEWSIAVERLMEEQRHLVARSERTPGEEKRLVELQKKLLSLPTESPEDERAMEIIRRAAAAIESQDRR